MLTIIAENLKHVLHLLAPLSESWRCPMVVHWLLDAKLWLRESFDWITAPIAILILLRCARSCTAENTSHIISRSFVQYLRHFVDFRCLRILVCSKWVRTAKEVRSIFLRCEYTLTEVGMRGSAALSTMWWSGASCWSALRDREVKPGVEVVDVLDIVFPGWKSIQTVPAINVFDDQILEHLRFFLTLRFHARSRRIFRLW